MNGNSDKHKPLSPEELFRLLETKNEGALSGDDLDDFEKEALEGFSAHTSSGKARQLTEEVHQRIHEKLDETKEKRPVGRIIWFGAAASVILGLIVSAYFLTQNAKLSKELALNQEVVEEMKNLPAAPVAREPVMSMSDEKQEAESKPQTPGREVTVSQDQSPSEELRPNAISEGSVAYKHNDDSRSKSDAFADANQEKSKVESKKSQGQAVKDDDLKLAETSDQEDRNVGDIANGTIAAKASAPHTNVTNTMPAAEKAQKESPVATYEGVSAVSQNSNKQTLKKRKGQNAGADKYATTTITGSAKTEENKGPAGSTRPAYYTGGDPAVKAHVETWFKEHQYQAPKGRYSIRMRIKADGTGEVLEVKAEKDGDENMVKPLKESLAAMKGWNPAMYGQQAADTETDFTLSF